MIKVLVGIIFFLLYLWIGAKIFYAAVNAIGGEEAYKQEIGSETYYVIALIAVLLFWPCFLISACLKGDK